MVKSPVPWLEFQMALPTPHALPQLPAQVLVFTLMLLVH
jgi:hypothetical protein